MKMLLLSFLLVSAVSKFLLNFTMADLDICPGFTDTRI